MERNQIMALVIVVLNSFSLLVLLALKDSGASGLIVGTSKIVERIIENNISKPFNSRVH